MPQKQAGAFKIQTRNLVRQILPGYFFYGNLKLISFLTKRMEQNLTSPIQRLPPRQIFTGRSNRSREPPPGRQNAVSNNRRAKKFRIRHSTVPVNLLSSPPVRLHPPPCRRPVASPPTSSVSSRPMVSAPAALSGLFPRPRSAGPPAIGGE
jgi:hypothetical protein